MHYKDFKLEMNRSSQPMLHIHITCFYHSIVSYKHFSVSFLSLPAALYKFHTFSKRIFIYCRLINTAVSHFAHLGLQNASCSIFPPSLKVISFIFVFNTLFCNPPTFFLYTTIPVFFVFSFSYTRYTH